MQRVSLSILNNLSQCLNDKPGCMDKVLIQVRFSPFLSQYLRTYGKCKQTPRPSSRISSRYFPPGSLLSFFEHIPKNALKSFIVLGISSTTDEEVRQITSHLLMDNYSLETCYLSHSGSSGIENVTARNRFYAKQSRFKLVKPAAHTN